MRILSGIQPSGELHLGNYFGAIVQHVALQDEGEALLRHALAVQRKLLGEEHPEVAMAMRNVADVLATQRKYAEAESEALRVAHALDRETALVNAAAEDLEKLQ